MRYLGILVSFFISSTTLAASQTAPTALSHTELTKVLSGLLLVLLIIVLLSWLVKRFNVAQFSSSKGFEMIASMMLGPKEKVVLIKAGSRYLLIGIGAGAVNTLHDFGEQMPAEFNYENKTSFAELLKSAVRKPSS